MAQRSTMMAALEEAAMQTAQQLVADTNALMPAIEDAARRGVRDVSTLLPAWLAKAGNEADDLPVPELLAVFQKAYAQQHMVILSEVAVPYGANETATAAALTEQLGIDLSQFIEDFWRDSALYSQHALPQ